MTTSDALTFSALGMLIVFAVLAALAVFIGLLRRLDARWQAAPTEPTQTIDDTTLVIIAATVATLLGGRGRVRSIRRVLPSDGPASVWSMQGRASLQGSHVITRRGRG
ncbi:MAG: hypothetical protein AMXMBFR64_07700 [Myxococcales bacterium]